MTCDRSRVLRSALAMIREHYGEAVVIVPDRRKGVRIYHAGNDACGKGLIDAAYEQVFGGTEPSDDDSEATDAG